MFLATRIIITINEHTFYRQKFLSLYFQTDVIGRDGHFGQSHAWDLSYSDNAK